jgi:aryl-alcohol dehydrogenase-like predicted oxidoreductase
MTHNARMTETSTTAMLGDRRVGRIGFGAMQLAGPGVFGPPRDRDAALAVLRRAVQLGVDHIDTSQYYGPDVVNELIREALHPYPDDLRLATKVGATRDASGGWLAAQRFTGGPAKLAADPAVARVAAKHHATASQVALAWLLHRDERILLIPGTSSVAHLEENLAAGEIVLDAEDLAALDDVRPAGDPLAAVGRE